MWRTMQFLLSTSSTNDEENERYPRHCEIYMPYFMMRCKLFKNRSLWLYTRVTRSRESHNVTKNETTFGHLTVVIVTMWDDCDIKMTSHRWLCCQDKVLAIRLPVKCNFTVHIVVTFCGKWIESTSLWNRYVPFVKDVNASKIDQNEFTTESRSNGHMKAIMWRNKDSTFSSPFWPIWKGISKAT